MILNIDLLLRILLCLSAKTSVFISLFTPNLFASEPVVPWEYRPYKNLVWVSAEDGLLTKLSPEARYDSETLFREIREALESSFGGVCDWAVELAPQGFLSDTLRSHERFEVSNLFAKELTVIVSKSHAARERFLKLTNFVRQDPSANFDNKQISKLTPEQRKEQEDARERAASLNSVRTMESVFQRIDHVYVVQGYAETLERELKTGDVEEIQQSPNPKLSEFNGEIEDLAAALESGDVLAAVVPRSWGESLQSVARSVPTQFPWQPSSKFRNSDKAFSVAIRLDNEMLMVSCKEMDSNTHRTGRVHELQVVRRMDLGRSIAEVVRQSFTPVLRIEESDHQSTVLRLRAGNLIANADHPASIAVGDVLQPYIRRDDLFGNPTILQPLQFTFVATTEAIDESSLFYGAIFTATRGILTAAKNRRTQRLAMRVEAAGQSTDLALTYRVTALNAAEADHLGVVGAEIYRRTPGADDLERVGRTDWRGIITIPSTPSPTLRYIDPTKSKNISIAKARQLAGIREPDPVSVEQGQAASDMDPEVPLAVTAEDEAEAEALPSDSEELSVSPEQKEVRLRSPLFLYYVKSGEVLLARLPIVAGFTPLEEARLPDDRRRLETEAYLKGIQNQVLDLVVRRKILESRFNTRLERGETEEAKRVLDELKRLKSYDRIADDIARVQRDALAPERGRVGPNIERRINQMVQSTRDLVQRWLQEDVIRKLEAKISEPK